MYVYLHAHRPVHLEVDPNISEDSFVLAFRQFVSRKSLPKVLISDNATTFIAGSEEIRRLCESDTIREYQHTAWNGDSYQRVSNGSGGFWERLIGLTKTSLKKSAWPISSECRDFTNNCHRNRYNLKR